MGRSRLRGQGVRGGSSLKHGSRLWRVGYFEAPLKYPPPSVRGWNNRFDDPDHTFGTLYCAQQRLTALREVLQECSPDLVALKDFRDLLGESLPPGLGRVGSKLLAESSLGLGRLDILSGNLVRLDSLEVRSRLEREHLDLLIEYGVKRLDISTIRSKDQRAVTQRIARSLYEQGAAGIVYRSNLDNHLSYALFEGRANLVELAPPELLADPVRGMGQVCRELNLVYPYRQRPKV